MLAQGLCPWSASDVAPFLQAVCPGLTSILSLPPTTRALVTSPHELYHAVGALWQAVPSPWRSAVRDDAVDDGEAMRLLLRSLWWGLPSGPTPSSIALPMPPAALCLHLTQPRSRDGVTFTVQRATSQLLYLAGTTDLISAALTQCVQTALALGQPAAQDHVRLCVRLQHRPVQRVYVGFVPTFPDPPPQTVMAALRHLRVRMHHVWRLPWDNKWKEVWWRLLLGGLQGAGGHGVCLRGACPCGWEVPQYLDNQQGAAAQAAHVMWHCPPARAVRDLLQHHLPPSTHLLPEHLWLLSPPSPSIHPGVWAVVALAALHAIYAARSYMWAQRCHRAEVVAPHPHNQRQLQLGDCPGWRCPPAPPAACLLDDDLTFDGQELPLHASARVLSSLPSHVSIPHVAARRAVAETMAAVRDFVHGGEVPRPWVCVRGDHHHPSPRSPCVLDAAHPFLGVDAVQTDGQMRHVLSFRMRLPPHLLG